MEDFGKKSNWAKLQKKIESLPRSDKRYIEGIADVLNAQRGSRKRKIKKTGQ